MKYVKSYIPEAELFAVLRECTADYGPQLEENLNFNKFIKEIKFLDRIESAIPEALRFDLEFDMILSKRTNTVTNYYKGLLEGRNDLLNEAQKRIDLFRINEAINKLKEFANSKKINESIWDIQVPKSAEASIEKINAAAATTATEAPKTAPSGEFDAALSGDAGLSGTSGGVWGSVKSLLSALTEGGSAIGIVHLVLDLVGLFGDFLGPALPLGLIADILNGLIYLYRAMTAESEEKATERYILAAISLIAAVIPVAGDVLKGFKGVAAPAGKVLYASAKGAKVEAEALKIMKTLPGKQRGLFARFMEYIAKTIGPALAKIATFLESFFKGFLGKITSYIPLIGKPLSKFFDNIAAGCAKFADSMTPLKSLDNLTESAAKLSVQNAEQFMKSATKGLDEGAEIIKSGDNVVIKHTDGTIEKFAVEDFANAAAYNKKFPNGPMADFFKKGGAGEAAAADYYVSLSKLSTQAGENIIGKTISFGVKSLVVSKKGLAFFAKQIVKLMFSKELAEATGEKEAEAFAGTAIQDLMDKRFKDMQDKDPNFKYGPVLIEDGLRDQEFYKALVAQQNYYADRTGLPHIIPVAYLNAKEAGEDIPEDADLLMSTMYSPMQIEKMENTLNKAPELTSESTTFKHVRSYGDFLKS